MHEMQIRFPLRLPVPFWKELRMGNENKSTAVKNGEGFFFFHLQRLRFYLLAEVVNNVCTRRCLQSIRTGPFLMRTECLSWLIPNQKPRSWGFCPKEPLVLHMWWWLMTTGHMICGCTVNPQFSFDVLISFVQSMQCGQMQGCKWVQTQLPPNRREITITYRGSSGQRRSIQPGRGAQGLYAFYSFSCPVTLCLYL